jgi:hypothetical protein
VTQCSPVRERTLYLDESGDLGFGAGGSSYLTIAFLSTTEPAILKRAIRRAKQKLDIPSAIELKGSALSWPQRKEVLGRVAGLDLSIHAVVVKKACVYPRLQRDQNLIYNYAAHLPFAAHIIGGRMDSVIVVVDQRTKKILSGGLELDRYLKMKIWAEEGLDTDLRFHYVESHNSLGIQAADVVANAIWRKYERGQNWGYEIVEGLIQDERRLFFG